jgi:hypothetical protein
VKSVRATIVFVIGCWLAVAPLPSAAQGTGRTKPRPGGASEVKRLDAKMDEVREAFLRDTNQLIRSYEEVGQFDRAKVLLEALQKLDPQNQPIKEKLAQLNKEMLDATEFEFSLEPGSSWQPVGTVTRGKPLRIKVAGEYKLKASLEAGPDGAPTTNPVEDLVPHVPFGAVMAVIANPTFGQRTEGGPANPQPPKPFTVGSKFEKPADLDGLLFLKVNLPPGAKCTGGLTARISGAVPTE